MSRPVSRAVSRACDRSCHVNGPYLTGMAASRRASRVPQLLDAAFAVGTLTTIATGGALLGLGWRDGEPGRVFRLAGRGILERFGVASVTAPLTSVALGYLHHLVIATAWGVLLACAILPLRGVWRVVGALTGAAFYLVLSLQLLPALLRVGYGVTGTVNGAVAIAVSLAVALLAGVWVAAGEGGDDDTGAVAGAVAGPAAGDAAGEAAGEAVGEAAGEAAGQQVDE